MASMLQKKQQETAEQVQQLRLQIQQQENLLKNIFQPLSKEPYYLHGVCIHDGSAESGHYYTLIKDHHQNVWREFNDVRVRQLSEEEVLAHSLGGVDKRSAYWLVYISAETRQKYTEINQNLYSPVDPSYNIQLHEYGKFMRQALVQAEEEKNKGEFNANILTMKEKISEMIYHLKSS